MPDNSVRMASMTQRSHGEHLFHHANFGLVRGRFSDNRFLSVNEAFARQRGYLVEELVGQPIFSVIAPEGRRAAEERIGEIRHRGHLAFESVHQRKDGTKFPVVVEVAAIKDAPGNSDLWVAYALDISERKRVEEEVRRSSRHLRMLSREAQRAEEKERRRLSRELHDEFGQLVSGLRLNLARVREELPKRPGTKGMALRKHVMAATKTADRLVASLKELVHGLQPAILDELGLVAALQSMAENIREGKGIDCRLSVEPEKLDPISGLELGGAIYRITQELVTNVVRHAKATRADIALHCADGAVTLVVQDNGRGGRFVGPKKGYGLRGIHERTEALGGQVEIQSVRRKGTTVTIPVERLSQSYDPIGSGRPLARVRTKKLSMGRTCRCLVIDDHPLLRHAIKEVIHGHFSSPVVREASTGDEAIRIARAEPVEIAILDISLPDSSGLTVLRRIKHERPSLKCLVLTMHDHPQYVRLAMSHGASGYLTKGATTEELREAIRTVQAGGQVVMEPLREFLDSCSPLRLSVG